LVFSLSYMRAHTHVPNTSTCLFKKKKEKETHSFELFLYMTNLPINALF
jgi:hypothetical protein